MVSPSGSVDRIPKIYDVKTVPVVGPVMVGGSGGLFAGGTAVAIKLYETVCTGTSKLYEVVATVRLETPVESVQLLFATNVPVSTLSGMLFP